MLSLNAPIKGVRYFPSILLISLIGCNIYKEKITSIINIKIIKGKVHILKIAQTKTDPKI
jgi:hypothetical protein